MEKSPSIKVHRVTDPRFLNLRSTLVRLFSGETVFVSFEVEKMRMFLVQSIVRWYWVLVRSWGAVVSFPVWNHWPGKVWFQLATVSWLSCRQQASLFMARAWKSCLPFSVTNYSFTPSSGPPTPYFLRYKRPSISVIPAPHSITRQGSRRDQKILEEGGGAGPPS